MAVLSKATLIQLASTQELLGKNYDLNNFEASSYDLRVGTIYKNDTIWSLDHPQDHLPFVEVKPSEIITLLTLEQVKIPSDCAGLVFPLNSHSSKGLLILNPGHIDPGFNGPLSVCAINLSKTSIKLALKDKIFTLLVNRLDVEVDPGDLYQNKMYSGRKELEKTQFKNRFSNLSSSFFDLIVGYEKTRSLLLQRVYERFKSRVRQIGALLIFIAGILSGIYLIFPDSVIFGSNNSKDLNDSIGNLKEENIKLRSEIKFIKDSLNRGK